MEKLKNSIIEKLASEGRISFMPQEETQRIYLATHEKMTQYKRAFAKKQYYSNIAAGKTILNS